MVEQLSKRLIDGNYANDDKIIARCHLRTHRGFLTKNLVKSHNCIVKECPFLDKMGREYWQNLEIAKQTKKDNRLKIKINGTQTLKMKHDRDAFIREILENSGSIHVTAIREEYRNSLVIYYIYDRKIDLTPEIRILGKKLGKIIKLQAKVGSEGVIEQLIRKPRRETRKITDVRKAPKVGAATKKRLTALGVHCLEDLFSRSGEALYKLDCELSGESINRRYLAAYRSAVEFADKMERV
ncbi:MAG: hypothetical protein LBL37_03085 [Gracilibacteraceae bacterium]|jgi:hypothetical protein|nr:hypothetical protein [Gracilibacteraceae bacterium]